MRYIVKYRVDTRLYEVIDIELYFHVCWKRQYKDALYVATNLNEEDEYENNQHS